MLVPAKNDALRKALELTGLTWEEHAQEIERLRLLHAHTIRFISGRRDETCALFALALTDQPVYRSIALTYDIYAGQDFLHSLDLRLTELPHPEPGCLVHYFAGDEWKHVGVMATSLRVISKWGTFPRYEHEFWEVPAGYGERMVFQERPSPDVTLELFLNYARMLGLPEGAISNAAGSAQ